MRPLSEAEVLEVWERGRGRSAQEQALAPLQALAARPASPAGPSSEPPPEELPPERLPVGERDRRLLLLRRATLGPQLHGAASCPRCGALVDFSVGVDEVLAAGAVTAPSGLRLTAAGFELILRLLDSRDLALAAEAGSLAGAHRRLLEQAVVSISHQGQPATLDQLSAEAVAAVAQALEAHDPLAVVPLALICNRCGGSWQPLLDVAAFIWRELEARAERVMMDVHALAQGYGWSEATILAMSPARRQFYLDLVPAQRVRGGQGEEGAPPP